MVKSSSYDLLKYLSQYLTITEIAKQKKCSRTSIYRGLNKLIDKGLVKKIGHVYEVTEKGVHVLNKSLPNKIRLHNLAFKISIYNKPLNWDLRRNKIVQLRSYSKSIDLKNNNYEIHHLSNIKVKTTTNSIIFYMPTFYGKTTDDCFKDALDMLWDNIPKIEHLFKLILIKDRKCNLEIISQHYSKLQDSIAKIYHNQDKKLIVRDKDGNIRIIADYSFRVDELESIYNKTAKEDMDTMQHFIQDLLNNPVTVTQMMSAINQVTANQMMFAKNIESHIGAIQSLSKEVKGLGKSIRVIVKQNNDLKLKNKHQTTLSNYGN